MLEQWEDERMESNARDIFGDDDVVGYFDNDDDYDDWGTNAADGAFDPESLHSD